MDKVESSSVATTSQKSTSRTGTLRTGAGQMFASAVLLSALIPFGGCRICADCDETAYAAYGGAWQRTTRDSGRVGSIFDPAGGLASELVSRDAPESPDAQERARKEAFGTGDADLDRAGDEEEDKKRWEAEEDSLDKSRDLQERRLEDIEEEKEEELRKKELNEINVRIIPGQPLPPVLR